MSDQKKIERRTFCKVLGASALAPAVFTEQSRADLGVRRTARRGVDLCEEIPSLCDLCFWRCGILAKVKQGRLVRIEGNPDHPRNKGRLCARGTGGRHLVENPDRLRTPLLRTGNRGEGRWKPISWDRALDLWAEKMRATIDEHGPGAIGLFSHGLSSRFLSNFINHLGCPNNSAPSFGQCRGPRDVGFQLTFGDGPGSPARHDMARSRMIVLFGCHIGENVQTGQVVEFAEALGRGARLVVVDPRMSIAASKADRWLQIRPGTDTALLLAWIHILIAECLYDREYVDRYTTGFDELRKAVAPYRPEWAAEVTQIPREVIEAEARAMAERRPAVLIHCGRFSTWYGNDTQRARAMAILTALLGAWGRPGGYYMKSNVPLGPRPCPPPHKGMDRSVATGRHAFTRFGVAAQEIVEASVGPNPRIRQWMFCAVNPAHSIPDFHRTREAMRSLDFITMIDMIPTEGALWADLILPEASYLERHDDVLAVLDHPQPFVALRQPVVPPVGQAKGLYWIVQQLAHRMGHDDCFTQPDVTGYLDARLAPLGLTYKQLARKGIHLLNEQQPFLSEGEDFPFETPSNRIELYSETMKSQGYQPLPTFEPVKQPLLGWFRLISGRSPYHSFARTQNLPRLMEKDPQNHLWLNQGVAKAKGLATGDEVFLQNEDGVRTGPIPLLVTPAIRTDVVYMVHGYGSRSRALSRAYASGVSDNALTSRFQADAPTGGTGIRVNFVQLVTQDGREISGEFQQCRAQRSPLPPVPETVAPLEMKTDTGAESIEKKQKEKQVDGVPAKPPADNGFFRVKPEESC